jgi:ferrous iron transport protein B
MVKSKKRITVALAGNPNTGKSTIFNNLTGSRQHVGNYPGVTVEKKEGRAAYKNYDIVFVDLPGTYSLSASSQDEVVARNYVIVERPDVVIHVVDASNLERNLYLYTQLSELDAPVIVAMNMSDTAEKKGHTINYPELSRLLGKPVVPTVGSKNKGMDVLMDMVVQLHEGTFRAEKSIIDYGEEIETELEKLSKLLKKEEAFLGKYHPGWLCLKLLEHDPWVVRFISEMPGGRDILLQNERSRDHLKKHFSDDPEVIIAEKRYGFISGVCTQARSCTVEQRLDISDRVDRVVLDRFLGLPIFALVMYIIFKFTFAFSEPVVGWFEAFFEKVGTFASGVMPEGLFRSFVVDGLIGGVGGVLGFFPLVLCMFFAIAFFEDTGYMARAAFVMDRIMHTFGLHGKSFLPLMISTNGCAVPGIMASRTLSNEKDRLITMMVTPFMICGAKLPIFALFIGAFFPAKHGAHLMFLMYVLSVALALASAWALKKCVLRGEVSHFVMELPPYRLPTVQGLLLKMWERGWLYLKKAGTIILMISILIWAGFTFPRSEPGEGMNQGSAAAAQMERSFAGRFGKFIEPAVKPLGMDWRGGVALLSGAAAKEVVVSTLGTIYSLGEVDPEETGLLKDALRKDPDWSPLKALTFLVFCLIYLPCVVAMAVFYRESGSRIKWTLFLIVWTAIMAWVMSFMVYQGGKLLGWGV